MDEKPPNLQQIPEMDPDGFLMFFVAKPSQSKVKISAGLKPLRFHFSTAKRRQGAENMWHVWYICLHEWLKLMVNVGKYTVHGAYG